jgi:hypothetical protein
MFPHYRLRSFDDIVAGSECANLHSKSVRPQKFPDNRWIESVIATAFDENNVSCNAQDLR